MVEQTRGEPAGLRFGGIVERHAVDPRTKDELVYELETFYKRGRFGLIGTMPQAVRWPDGRVEWLVERNPGPAAPLEGVRVPKRLRMRGPASTSSEQRTSNTISVELAEWSALPGRGPGESASAQEAVTARVSFPVVVAIKVQADGNWTLDVT